MQTKINRKQWEYIGKQAGWLKTTMDQNVEDRIQSEMDGMVAPVEDDSDNIENIPPIDGLESLIKSAFFSELKDAGIEISQSLSQKVVDYLTIRSINFVQRELGISEFGQFNTALTAYIKNELLEKDSYSGNYKIK